MPRRLRNNISSIPDVGDIVSYQAETILLISNENIIAEASAWAVAPVKDVWERTPLPGNFNPGTKLGNSIYLEKTKILSEADYHDLNKANLLAIDADFSRGWTNVEHLNLEAVI